MPKVELKQLMQMTPETLAEHQYNELKKAAVERLRELITLINKGSLDKAEGMLAESPSGDCMGCDNSYINFRDIYGEDIGDVIGRLDQLSKMKG